MAGFGPSVETQESVQDKKQISGEPSVCSNDLISQDLIGLCFGAEMAMFLNDHRPKDFDPVL